METDDGKNIKTPTVESDVEGSKNGDMGYGEVFSAIDPVVQKRVVWKLDTRLLPLLSLMYLFNSVDRSNLGNAKTDGLEGDLHMHGNQYSITLVLFYITFCLLDLPMNLLLKRFSGKIMLPTLMIGWGSMTMLQCAAHNWAGLIVLRLIMGAFEAGFFAGVTFYLTLFYTRNELAFRMAIFYGSATIAGAFSGLLAFGVFQIKDPHVPGWKWLMIIEGGATVILASCALWILPKSMSQCSWFTEEEKIVGEQRLLQDCSVETDEKFDLKTALKRILDIRIMIWASIGFSYGVATASVANFLPQMVQRLGFTIVKTNLYTVAPYCVGCVVLLAITRSSDLFRERSLHLCFSMCLTMIGYIILIKVDTLHHKGLAYFACFLLTSGAFAPSCLFHSWHNNNQPSENGRAAITGVLVGASNSGGIVSSIAFKSNTAPKYLPALIVTAVFQAIGILLSFAFGMYLRWDNKKRDAAQGVKLKQKDVPTDVLARGPKDPSWRWLY